ncbi:MAG: sugar phosphate isomerase/epimerase family protein [Lachnospirales bacterium]
MKGVRARDFGKLTAKDICKKTIDYGFDTVSLSLSRALIEITDTDNIDNELLLAIKDVFNNYNVGISSLCAHLRFSCEDKEKRDRNFKIYSRYLRYGKMLGARNIALKSGSYNDDHSLHFKNHTNEGYRKFADYTYSLAEQAEMLEIDIAIEGAFHHIIYDNKSIKRLIDDISSPRLRVIFDPVHLITMENYKEQEFLIKEAFYLFGDKIDVIHLKDFVVAGTDIILADHGMGMFDYETLFDEIHKSKNEIDIIIEGLNVSRYTEAIRLLDM